MPQHNPTAERVPITLDKERHLLLDFNALAEAEGPLGISLIANPAALEQQVKSFRGIRALLWAALLADDPSLTLADAGAIIQQSMSAGESLQTLAEAIERAAKASWPEAASAVEEEGEPGNVRNRSAGSKSGRSGGTTSGSRKKNSGG